MENDKNSSKGLILRMAQLKVAWPFKNHTIIYEAHCGKVMTEEVKKKVHDVWCLRKADQKITEIFEGILNSSK